MAAPAELTDAALARLLYRLRRSSDFLKKASKVPLFGSYGCPLRNPQGEHDERQI
jgi:hypothetical protein